jgi:hypothetical protein
LKNKRITGEEIVSDISNDDFTIGFEKPEPEPEKPIVTELPYTGR